MGQPSLTSSSVVGRRRVRKRHAAGLSVASNTGLILLKVIAATLTGSVALLTEAVHSSVDLVASVVAFYSVGQAEKPADESHRYGHEKIENLAALIEAVLVLVGSAAIAFEAARRLISGGSTHTLPVGIAAIAVSIAVNLAVSRFVARSGRDTGSPALAGDAIHLFTDALSSLAVLLALVLVEVTGAQWIDPVAAMLVAGWIVTAGLRLLLRAGQALVDQALPTAQTAVISQAIEGFADRGVVGYHELRTRSGGSQRWVDLHVQFRAGTSLEEAHLIAHELADAITAQLGGADVLIHIEPEHRVRPGARLTAADPASGEAADPLRGR